MADVTALIARPPTFNYNELADPLAGYTQGRQLRNQMDISAGRSQVLSDLPRSPDGGINYGEAAARLLGINDIEGAKSLAAIAQSQGQQTGVYGTPIYGQGPNGETVIGTFDKTGRFKQIQTPGFTPTLPVKPLDTGTGYVMTPGRAPFVGGQPSSPRATAPQLDINSEGIPPSQAARVNAPQVAPTALPVQAQPMQLGVPSAPGFIPKDVEGREAAEARGKARGQAQAAYPEIISTASTSLRLIDEAIKHPGRETGTGLSRRLDPRNYIAGTSATDFGVRSQQLEARTFLDAFQQLRGGGAITESEGQKATLAHARLERSQSDDEYLAALKELRGIIAKGVKVARLKAQGKYAEAERELGMSIPDVTVTAPGAAAGPSIDDLVKKYSQ